MTEQEKRILRDFFEDDNIFKTAAVRLKAGEPLAYIIGEWYFRNQTYKVTPDVLVPRPDTELLVEQLVLIAPDNGYILDLCTGSGCIAISTLCERPDLRGDAVDISRPAVQIAGKNAEINGVAPRLRIIEANAENPLLISDLQNYYNRNQIYDIIVSNPPYIRTSVIESLSLQVKSEPRIALDGGVDGMRYYRAFLKMYPPLLKKGGVLLFEIGYDQAKQIKALAASYGASGCEIFKDYGGNDRVAKIYF